MSSVPPLTNFPFRPFSRLDHVYVGVSPSFLSFPYFTQIITLYLLSLCRPPLSFRGHAFEVRFAVLCSGLPFRLSPRNGKESSLFIPSFREFLFRRLPTATCRPHVGNSLHFHRSVLTNKNLFESFQ